MYVCNDQLIHLWGKSSSHLYMYNTISVGVEEHSCGIGLLVVKFKVTHAHYGRYVSGLSSAYSNISAHVSG